MYAVEKERIPLIQLLWMIIIYCEHINHNNSGNNRIIIKKNVSVHFGSRIQVKSSQVSWAHGCRWWLWWCIVMSKTMFSFYEFHCLKLTAHQRRFHSIFRSIFRAHLYRYVCVCVLLLFVHIFYLRCIFLTWGAVCCHFAAAIQHISMFKVINWCDLHAI